MVLTHFNRSQLCNRLRVSLPGLLFLLWLIMSSGIVNAQDRPVWLNPWGTPEKPLNCEENLIHIEIVARLASEESQRDKVLIIVARLGDNESSQELNRRRLHNLRVSLTENLRVDPQRLIMASGEKVRGSGRVEFYLAGKLIGALPIARGKDLCVDCCDIDERYYPYRKNEKRGRQRRE